MEYKSRVSEEDIASGAQEGGLIVLFVVDLLVD
jgi:hypothetical protein